MIHLKVHSNKSPASHFPKKKKNKRKGLYVNQNEVTPKSRLLSPTESPFFSQPLEKSSTPTPHPKKNTIYIVQSLSLTPLILQPAPFTLPLQASFSSPQTPSDSSPPVHDSTNYASTSLPARRFSPAPRPHLILTPAQIYTAVPAQRFLSLGAGRRRSRVAGGRTPLVGGKGAVLVRSLYIMNIIKRKKKKTDVVLGNES